LAVLEIIPPVLLIAVCIAGAIASVFQLPGTWLILAASVAYAWYDGWAQLGWQTLILLAVIALAAELTEALAGFWATRKAGASSRAAWWGLVGGVAGAFVLSVPVPIVGTIVGGAVGCFVAALAAELSLERSASDGTRAGFYAAVGRLFGTVLKIQAAVIMLGIVVVALLF
jgi:uncharacterized protein YqgC (DUF456 family)